MPEMQSKSVVPPGLAEDKHFKLDESVAIWKAAGQAPGPDNIRKALSIAASMASEGPNGIVYSLAHGVRTGYFAANAAIGTLSSALREQVQGSGVGSLMSTQMKIDGEEQGISLELALFGASTLLLETAMTFQQDFRAIRNGLYKLPWDIYTPGHRQFTPQFAAQETARVIEEMVGILDRAARGGRAEDIGIWLDSPLYPDYYKNNFHYQTDGWMASRSAKVYETSTETIFMGRQDAMQRLSLIPLREVATANSGAPRILEVAAGTGRFSTFMRDNHPNAQMTIVDLSPFYLEMARENDEYWRKMRFPNEEVRPQPARFVQAAAEALPFEDESFDAVVCVYLFHEMPEAERAAAAAEMARVVAPGGVVILTDSQQLGDRPALDGKIGNFAKLNEPHYQNYISTYLPALFTAGGLTCDGKWAESSTKCLSFRKPASSNVSQDAVSS
jgi:ubiquinone/menaquinone biosynthesis C-methylase UbiE